jgi:sialate O-acetylesterase
VVTKGRRRIAEAAAKVRGNEFTLQFVSLPAGGPYSVIFTDGKKRLVVKDVLVGDVWICAGPSNMQGLGYLQYAEKPHPQVRAFYMDDHWAVARDPLGARSIESATIELLNPLTQDSL